MKASFIYGFALACHKDSPSEWIMAYIGIIGGKITKNLRNDGKN